MTTRRKRGPFPITRRSFKELVRSGRNHNRVCYSEVFIDKLTLVIDLSDERLSEIKDVVKQAERTTYPDRYYRHNVKIYTDAPHNPEEGFFHLAWDPKQADFRNFKISFNPNHNDMETLLVLLNVQYDIDFIDILNKAKVRQVDLSLDLYNCIRQRVSIQTIWFQTNKNYFGSKGVSTEYIGSFNSERNIVIYDKKAERFDKHKQPYCEDANVTRIELRIKQRSGRDYTLREYYDEGLKINRTTNIFRNTRLRIAKIEQPNYFSLRGLLMARVADVGVTAALSPMSQTQKIRAKEMLDKYTQFNLCFDTLYLNNRAGNLLDCINSIYNTPME